MKLRSKTKKIDIELLKSFRPLYKDMEWLWWSFQDTIPEQDRFIYLYDLEYDFKLWVASTVNNQEILEMLYEEAVENESWHLCEALARNDHIGRKILDALKECPHIYVVEMALGNKGIKEEKL